MGASQGPYQLATSEVEDQSGYLVSLFPLVSRNISRMTVSCPGFSWPGYVWGLASCIY